MEESVEQEMLREDVEGKSSRPAVLQHFPTAPGPDHKTFDIVQKQHSVNPLPKTKEQDLSISLESLSMKSDDKNKSSVPSVVPKDAISMKEEKKEYVKPENIPKDKLEFVWHLMSILHVSGKQATKMWNSFSEKGWKVHDLKGKIVEKLNLNEASATDLQLCAKLKVWSEHVLHMEGLEKEGKCDRIPEYIMEHFTRSSDAVKTFMKIFMRKLSLVENQKRVDHDFRDEKLLAYKNILQEVSSLELDDMVFLISEFSQGSAHEKLHARIEIRNQVTEFLKKRRKSKHAILHLNLDRVQHAWENVDYIWENQRKFPSKKLRMEWKDTVQPMDRFSFSDDGGHEEMQNPLELNEAYEVWEWQVQVTEETDAEGWLYALNFPSALGLSLIDGFTNEQRSFHCVRKRKWIPKWVDKQHVVF